MRPRTPAAQSIGTARAIVALACLFVTSANPGHGQSAAPTAAPATASVLPSATSPIPASPLTYAQNAMLTGKLADFVSQFATTTGIKLVPIPAGTFRMGSPADEAGRTPGETPHQVALTQDYWLGATDVTQAQWTAMINTNPSIFKGDTLPVENVPWDNAMAFCDKLTEQERKAGRLPVGYIFTLPTEAQWEYACRAGTTGPYAGDLDAMAWYIKNSGGTTHANALGLYDKQGNLWELYSGGTTHAVGTKQANAWGLYDTQGNVWEWCSDWWGDYPNGAVTDPTGPASGRKHVVRGGNWSSGAAHCRSAVRSDYGPGGRDVGFRLALSAVR